MKKIIIKLFILILTMGSIYSCVDDDFIVVQNPNEITVADFFKDLSETGAGLNTVYQKLHDPFLVNIWQEILRSDMGYPGFGRPSPQNTEDFYLHTYNGSTREIINKWTSNYQGIFRANQVIRALNTLMPDITPEEEEEWTSQMAQARFFRGLFHYYLYSTYNNGEIIIRDFVPQSPEDFAKPLSPAEDVLAFIREDLEYAYANLFKKGEYPDGDLARVTSGAAGTILGTTYLNELNYERAMTFFDDIITNHGYELEDDLSKIFTNDGEFNKESIFEINFTAENIQFNLNAFNGDSGTNVLNIRTFITRSATGPAWIANAYKSEPMDPLDLRNYFTDSLNPTSTLRAVPLRASSMMALVDDNQTTYYLTGTTSEYPRFGATGFGFGWYKKYQNHDIVDGENSLPGGNRFSSKNIILNRLSEVLLMQAECKIKTGAINEAIDLINQIRRRWGLVLLGPTGTDIGRTYDNVTYTPQSLMDHLMRIEKPLELSAEGHAIRFLDFQRWKISDNYGFKDRLEELSNSIFYGVDFEYTDSEGELQTRGNNPAIEAVPSTLGDNVIIDFEYDIPFLNYNESIHGQYPIPLPEVNANPNIN